MKLVLCLIVAIMAMAEGAAVAYPSEGPCPDPTQRLACLSCRNMPSKLACIEQNKWETCHMSRPLCEYKEHNNTHANGGLFQVFSMCKQKEACDNHVANRGQNCGKAGNSLCYWCSTSSADQPETCLDYTPCPEGIVPEGGLPTVWEYLKTVCKRISGIEQNVVVISEINSDQDDDIDALKISNATQAAAIDDLEGRTDDLEAAITVINAKNDAQDVLITDLVNKNDDLDAAINDLKTNDEAQDVLIDDLVSTTNALNATIVALQTQNDAQDVSIKNLEDANIAQNTDIQDLKTKNSAQDTLIQNLTAENIAQNSQIQNLQGANDAQDTEILNLQDANDAQDVLITAQGEAIAQLQLLTEAMRSCLPSCCNIPGTCLCQQP